MDAGLQHVYECLQSTLSANQQERQAAEASLKQNELVAGHVVSLFRLAADVSLPVETPLRQAAVILMKSIIARRWSGKGPAGEEDATTLLGDADKATVRTNLVEAIVVAPQVVRSQLGLCLRSIASSDYPSRWPELLPSICSCFQQQSAERVRGALFSLRVLVKNYEFRRDENREAHACPARAPFPLASPPASRQIAAAAS